MCENFHSDRLRNDRALGNRKSGNNKNPRNNNIVRRAPAVCNSVKRKTVYTRKRSVTLSALTPLTRLETWNNFVDPSEKPLSLGYSVVFVIIIYHLVLVTVIISFLVMSFSYY